MTKEQFEKANRWFDEHRAHVNRLIRSNSKHYEPTGSDANNPALWKTEHWNWFFLELK